MNVRGGDGVIGLGARGLTAFAGDGTRRFSRPDAAGVTVAGAYAYVQRAATTDVVELASGHVAGSAPVRISVVGVSTPEHSILGHERDDRPR